MKILRQKTNRIVNPLGFELKQPKLSWTVEDAKGKEQKWARVIVAADDAMENVLFDSGEDAQADSKAYPINIELKPRTRYYWNVTVCDELGNTASGEVNWFETGKMDEGFVGKMITPELPYDVCPYIRKTFTLDGAVKRARAYFTGLGIYELYINGKRVGDEYLAPYCDGYDKWLQYQTYDVTEYLCEGQNTIGVILGNGWAKGKFGFDGEPASYETGCKGAPCDIFTDIYLLLGDLVVETDKGEVVVATDETWQCAPSPITFSSIYDGERYEQKLEIENWCTPEGDDYPWSGVKLNTSVAIGDVTDRLSLPVKKQEAFKPSLIRTPAGEYVLDAGQEVTGWMEYLCDQPAGTEIRLQYGEILQDGNFYRDNMRSALTEYRFISDGRPHNIRPVTTFYGFRYMKVSGFVNEPKADDFTAWAIYSDLETTGNIKTDNPKINRLFKNCLWSQKDNFVDVPTDCPQRDERMGWTGDAQVFCPTANFNMDCLAFYTKYGKDVYIDQQRFDGRTPHVSPLIAKKDTFLYNVGGACGWADAAAVVPWMTYVFTGDKSILENQFDSMKAWADWVYRYDEAHGSTRLWLALEQHFGDWLALDGAKSGFDPEAVIGGTDNTFLCSAYYYISTGFVAKAARVLGKDDVAIVYENRAEEILNAIRDEFYTKGGRCAAATQTGNALSLHFGLAPEKHREKIKNELLHLLGLNDMHLKTGFLGTPVLCRALSDNGAHDAAFTLFLQEDYPSWLYEVNMGATTIWERWNSINPDGKISGIGMNSMNHYSYGAVIEWVYRNVCGINPVESDPGFKTFELRPQPDKRLGEIEAEFNSPMGIIRSEWKWEKDDLCYKFKVPFGAKALLKVKADELAECSINGNAVEPENGFVTAVLSAGEYVVR